MKDDASIRSTPDPYEPYLHRRLLRICRHLATHQDEHEQTARAEQPVRLLFEVLINTQVDALRRNAGRVLCDLLHSGHPGLRGLESDIARWAAEAVVTERGIWGIRELVTIDAVRDTLLPLLGHASNSVRRAVIRVLEPIVSDPAVRRALMPLISDPSWYVRWGVVVALESQVGLPKVREALQAQLSDPDVNVLKALVRVLGGDANPTIQETMPTRLNDIDPAIRRFAAQVIASACADESGISCLEPLVTHADAKVRRVAVQALKRYAINPAVQTALLTLLHDADAGVSYDAIEALKFASANGAIQGTLLGLLGHPDSSVQRRAIEALEPVASETRVREAIFSLIPDTEDSSASRWPCSIAIRVMARACTSTNPILWSGLHPLLTHRDFLVREEAVRALKSRSVDPIVQSRLLMMLHDPVWYVRLDAANALEPHTDNDQVRNSVREALLSMLTDPYESVRQSAAYSLEHELSAHTIDGAIQEALATLLSDPQDRIRSHALTALRKVPAEQFKSDAGLKEVVTTALDDKSDQVRITAAQTLESVAEEPTIREALLLAVRNDESMMVRQAAAWSLATGSHESVADDPEVQRVLVTMLGKRPLDRPPDILANALTTVAATLDGRWLLREQLMHSTADQRRVVLRMLTLVPPYPELRDVVAAMVNDWPVANEAFSTLSHWADEEAPELA